MGETTYFFRQAISLRCEKKKKKDSSRSRSNDRATDDEGLMSGN